MISFENFLMEDGIPIYLQIITWVKRGIASGQIKNGDALPSRRVLSALLGVNPNTVQKAYRLLEEEGLIASQSGTVSCIVLTPERREQIRRTLVASDIRGMVSAMVHLGLGKEEALALLEKYWEEENEG